MRDWAEVMAAKGSALPAARPIEILKTDLEVERAIRDGAQLRDVSFILTTGKPVKVNFSLDAGVRRRSTPRLAGADLRASRWWSGARACPCRELCSDASHLLLQSGWRAELIDDPLDGDRGIDDKRGQRSSRLSRSSVSEGV